MECNYNLSLLESRALLRSHAWRRWWFAWAVGSPSTIQVTEEIHAGIHQKLLSSNKTVLSTNDKQHISTIYKSLLIALALTPSF